MFSGYRSALSHRNLRLLLSGEVVSASGSWAYNVALAVYVFDRTHSSFWVSAVFLVRFIPAMFLSTYGGVLAERFERVRLLITSDLLLFTWQILLAGAVFLNLPVAFVLSLAALSAITSTAYSPAVAAMIPQLAGEDDLASANALNSTIDNLVVILGPAFGSLLLLTREAWLPFVINAATFVFAAVMVYRISERSHPSDVSEGGKAGVLRQMLVGMRAIVSSSKVMVLVSFSVLASFIYGTDTVLFVYISKLQLHTGATGYGYLLAGLGVGGVLAALFVNRLASQPRLGAIITLGMAVYCVPTALLIWVTVPEVGFLLEVIRGAGTLVVDVLAITALQRSVAADLVARVFGVFFALVLGAISLGSLLAAAFVQSVGLHGSLLLVGIVVPVLAAMAYPWLRRMDDAAQLRFRELAPRVELLSRLGIFSSGSRSVLERLAGVCGAESVTAGTVIIREGDEADAFYALGTGRVRVDAKGEAASVRQLAVIDAPGYFGEIGLLEQIPRTATVTALSDCELYRIAGEDFLDALSGAPASQLFLEGTKARLGRSHPSYRSRSDDVLPSAAAT
ncbi:MAG: MFS transporter [Candidatus Dormibacteraeota bacterium]|nr:MFS transporter [Candidatus Dormibacteraeota bacterium]